MSQEKSKYLEQCIDLTTEILNKGVVAYINIKVGEDFVFTFNNQDYKKEENSKTKSPSQIKRNKERKEKLLNRKVLEEKVKKEEISETLEDTIEAVDEPEVDRETLWMDCWDPDDHWDVKDVADHLDEILATVFKVFKVKGEDKDYKMEIDKKVGEKFPVKIDFKKSEQLRNVINNFRRDGNVKGGGCVKFIRIRKQEIFH